MKRSMFNILIAMPLALAPLACGDEATPLAGYERTPTPETGDLTLPAVEPDGAESDFRFRADDGDLLLVYFGYTSCPDVCPTTLSDVRRAVEGLGDDGERVDLAMVTIDPEVDTPDVLVGYVRSFIPEATAVRTADDDRLRVVADTFGVDYGKTAVDGADEVFHTGSLYVVDAAGDLILTWPFGTPSSDLGADLDQLLDSQV